jgi:acetyl-CoA C-acetyltransferase
MNNVVIVSASRTAIGAYGGTLKNIPAVDLGATTLKATLKNAGLRPIQSDDSKELCPEALRNDGRLELETQNYDYKKDHKPITIDQVILGNVLGAGLGQNPARQVMIKAGIPKETCATTVNKLCASGMESVAIAYQAIRSGDADSVLAGGMENMSLVPYALPANRWGQRMGNGEIVDLMVHDGLFEKFYGYHMGITAENIACRYGISRREQDEMGVLSHQRALAAIDSGYFREEIVPITIPQRKGDPVVVFDTDERPMRTDIEKMGRLCPAFKKDGTVTAGNASGINDAAASLLLMSERKAKEIDLTPIAYIRAHASAGVDPAYMGLGPIPAVKKILKKHKLSINDFDAIELNEAFASQVIACIRELGCDIDRTNTSGSGISLGHPIGCTGTRIIVSLLHQMRRNDLSLGLASLCIGGGQGMAMMVERNESCKRSLLDKWLVH